MLSMISNALSLTANHLYLLVALQRRGLRGRLPALLGLLRLGDWQCRGLRGRRRAL